MCWRTVLCAGTRIKGAGSERAAGGALLPCRTGEVSVLVVDTERSETGRMFVLVCVGLRNIHINEA